MYSMMGFLVKVHKKKPYGGFRMLSTATPKANKKQSYIPLALVGGVALGGIGYFKGQEIINLSSDSRLMPLLRLLDPESSHDLSILAVSQGFSFKDLEDDPSILKVNAFGRDFPNPLGMAAGFDKNGQAIAGILDIGFGFVEIGSITPKPQAGNAKPRLFRLEEDRGVINRYGFNSDGFEIVKKRLEEYMTNRSDKNFVRKHRNGVLGINLGKNKTSLDAVKDYVDGVKELGPYADYLVINVSSPNTPGLRSLQGKQELKSLIKKVIAVRDEMLSKSDNFKTPLLVKIAPDLTEMDKKDIAEVLLETKVDGLIVSNTTISRPEALKSKKKDEVGGLSGAPLKALSKQALHDMYRLTGGKLPLIGVGGIENGYDAYERICAGATLVQLYSALVYEGPGCVKRAKKELIECLERDGFKSVADAVGSAHRTKTKKWF